MSPPSNGDPKNTRPGWTGRTLCLPHGFQHHPAHACVWPHMRVHGPTRVCMPRDACARPDDRTGPARVCAAGRRVPAGWSGGRVTRAALPDSGLSTFLLSLAVRRSRGPTPERVPTPPVCPAMGTLARLPAVPEGPGPPWPAPAQWHRMRPQALASCPHVPSADGHPAVPAAGAGTTGHHGPLAPLDPAPLPGWPEGVSPRPGGAGGSWRRERLAQGARGRTDLALKRPRSRAGMPRPCQPGHPAVVASCTASKFGTSSSAALARFPPVETQCWCFVLGGRILRTCVCVCVCVSHTGVGEAGGCCCCSRCHPRSEPGLCWVSEICKAQHVPGAIGDSRSEGSRIPAPGSGCRAKLRAATHCTAWLPPGPGGR